MNLNLVAMQRKQPGSFAGDLEQNRLLVTDKVVWWSAAGLTHYFFLKRDESVNARKYCGQLDEMPRLLKGDGMILFHDNP